MPTIIKRILPAAAMLLLLCATSASASKSPSEAYLQFHSVLKQSFSDQAIWPYYVESARADFEQQFPPAMRGRAFYIMKAAAPATVRVEQETIQGNTATLVLAPTSSSQAERGEATMRLENGSWKLEKVVWQVP
jgi:hypothetical protein